MKTLLRFYKKVEKNKNRIIIPKCIIDKYGREYYLELLEDETIKLVPIRKDQ